MITKTAAQIAAKLSRAQRVAIPTLLNNYVHAAPITIKALESRGLIERRGAGRMQNWKLTIEGQKVSCLIYGTVVELDHAEALGIVAREADRGDHFGSCAKCGVSYEARSAEQAIEDHDMHEGHAFIAFAPSWQIEITREGIPVTGEAEAREVLSALFTQLHGYHEPIENQGDGIWLAAIPQPLADTMQYGSIALNTVTPANIRYEITIEMP